MPIVSLNQATRSVNLANAKTNHPLVFQFFDQLPEERREEEFERALVIGVMALMEERIAAFLARTENELGTNLEALKRLYERRQWVEARAAAGGVAAEKEIHNRIKDFLETNGHEDDKSQATGATGGALRNNKTGDIVIQFEGDPNRAIAVEVKFDSSISLGDWEDGDSTSKTRDTALSQLFESNANRETRFAVIVFDKNRCAPALRKAVSHIKWMPSAGFVVIIDHDRADYSHLFLAIDLLRTMTDGGMTTFDDSVLEALLSRMSQDLATISETQNLLRENNQNLQKIAKTIEKHAALVEFTRELIKKGLNQGRLDSKLLLELYRGERVVTELKPRLSAVEQLFPALGSEEQST
jgi:hypothetical protein